LKSNLKATLNAFIDAMVRRNVGTWPDAALEQKLRELQQPDSAGRLPEFCQVPIFWLRKHMGRVR
jgi:hypothetical protein